MGANLLQIDHGGLDEFLIDAAAVSVFGNIAFRSLEKFQKTEFQRVSEGLLSQLEGTTSVLDDLDRLNTREFIEKPSTTGIHEHSISLHFQKLQYCYFLSFVERPDGVLVQKGIHACG